VSSCGRSAFKIDGQNRENRLTFSFVGQIDWLDCLTVEFMPQNNRQPLSGGDPMNRSRTTDEPIWDRFGSWHF
jgi:hypothetical protein